MTTLPDAAAEEWRASSGIVESLGNTAAVGTLGRVGCLPMHGGNGLRDTSGRRYDRLMANCQIENAALRMSSV